MRLYTKAERSTFPYWFAHWLSFNMVAYRLGCWKLKWLFHDIEKPWLKLFFKNYAQVQEYHRVNSDHHLKFKGGLDKIDWLGMTIDWECSRFSKLEAPLNAFDTLQHELFKHKDNDELCKKMFEGISKNLIALNLCDKKEIGNLWQRFEEFKKTNEK